MNTNHPNTKGIIYAIVTLTTMLLSPDVVPFVPPAWLPYLKAAAAVALVIGGFLDQSVAKAKAEKAAGEKQ